MVHSELVGIGAAFTHFGQALTVRDTGFFSRLFQVPGREVDDLWTAVRNAGGNQFVLVETYPVIFTVSSLLALVYMVLHWPFTAFSHAKDDT